ncbi:MAG TPA: MDR family MFS transporter [Geomonas sp.]|nr:MDR family MFS transporter [Geomonas sp.]
MTNAHTAAVPEPISTSEIRTVFAGLMLALSLAALDQNIVGTALPRIVSDLGGLSHLSWVVTSFMLTSTATTPLYGKLSDMYGRKPLFVVSIMLFLIGSCLCGLSASMAQLVVFRGIQGLGAGGLITLAQTTIADLVSPRERGRYQGLFGAVFAFSSIAGPLLGGFITDALSWRWIFYVNLPVGTLALALIVFGFRRPQRKVSHRVDYAGVMLITAWTTTLLLVLTWGGTVYAWSSPTIVSMAAASAVFFFLLVRQERRAAEPVFSPNIFRNRIFLIASSSVGLTFMAMLGTVVFMPLFFQLVLGFSPSRAGLMMAPMTIGLIAASFSGGRIVSRTGRYKIFPVIGLALAVCSLLGVTWAALAGAGVLVLESILTMLGFGFGLVMPNFTVAIQNAVEPHELGMATATSGFFRSLGGAFGVALSGAIVTSQLHGIKSAPGSGNGARSLVEQGIQQIAQLPAAQKAAILAGYRNAISTTFVVGAFIALAAFAIAIFLPEKPLKTSPPSLDTEPEAGAGAAGSTAVRDAA